MDILIELSLIMVITTAISALMRLFKQPLIVGYILTGLLIGPFAFNVLQNTDTLNIFADLGISILLFIVGLNLSPKEIKEVGKFSLLAGILQIAVTFVLGFGLSILFKFNLITSLYLGMAFTFSSTIIALKLLSDKKDLEKLYSRVSIGILLVQDIAAMLVLVLVSSYAEGGNAAATFAIIAIKGILATGLLLLISMYILPRLGSFFAQSQEFLFVFSLGWGFGIAAVFNLLGFSLEIGALLAGITLSVSPYNKEMASKLKPLRDFFVLMFFVLLGMKMDLTGISRILLPALAFSSMVLLAKPLILQSSLGILGYNKKTGFFSGAVLSQISEFSLILALLGVTLKQIPEDALSLVTLTALITIIGSSYLTAYSEKIYSKISHYLKIFEGKKTIKESVNTLTSYDVILFGCNRVGYDFIQVFRKLGPAFLAVDFDPLVIKELNEKGINCRYGDAEDPEFLNELGVENTKVIISTIPDYRVNSFLLHKVRNLSKDTNIILISYNIDEALKLYDEGASYIILPHFIGGEYAAKLAHNHGFEKGVLHEKRKEHLEYLRERKALGHAHPEKNFS